MEPVYETWNAVGAKALREGEAALKAVVPASSGEKRVVPAKKSKR